MASATAQADLDRATAANEAATVTLRLSAALTITVSRRLAELVALINIRRIDIPNSGLPHHATSNWPHNPAEVYATMYEHSISQPLGLRRLDAAVADCAASRATLDAAAALMEALHVRERSVRAAFDRGEVTQFEGLSLALALAEAEAELQRATLTRIVLGSQLSRVTGLWSRSTSDSLADPLSWPAASAIVARSDQ